MCVAVVAAIIISSAVTEPSPIIKDSAPLPICRPEQSCSYYSAPYTFSLCLCPNHHRCPHSPEYTAVQDGTTYRFCTPRELPICEPNQWATSVTGILTSVHCLCPEELSLIKGQTDEYDTTRFYCGVIEYCRPGGYCGSLDEDDDFIIEECPCPPGTTCTVDSPLFWIFSRNTASCMPSN